MQEILNTPNIAKHGLYYHWIDAITGVPRPDWDGVSTVDSALFYAGAIVAGSRFGGLVDDAVVDLLLAADWSKFVLADEVSGFPSGYLSLAWEPDNEAQPTGPGTLMPFAWVDAMDEERLTVFLAQTQPDTAKSTDPNLWWSLRRPRGPTLQRGQTRGVLPMPAAVPHLLRRCSWTPRGWGRTTLPNEGSQRDHH